MAGNRWDATTPESEGRQSLIADIKPNHLTVV
jgi:hypothetical protein